MEITGILTFIGIFVSIVLILISIAYYGIKEPTYDEAVAVNSNESKKKSKKDISNKKQLTKTNISSSSSSTSSSNNSADIKKRTSSGETNKKANINIQESAEEDPIIIIPDPFTMQLSSRFAGATRTVTTANGSNMKKDVQNQQAIKVLKQQQYQKPKEDIAFEKDTVKELETENQGTFTVKTLEKVKPKATVKPNQNHVLSNNNFQSDFQIKNVALNGSLPQTQLSTNKLINCDPKVSKPSNNLTKLNEELVSNSDSILVNMQLKEKIKAMENTELTFNTKLKELNLELNEKIKQIDALNKANLISKNEIASLSTQMKDFETLKQTNQIIQREMTKGLQTIANLENQKKVFEKREEAYKRDMDILQEKLCLLESSVSNHSAMSENAEKKFEESGDYAFKLDVVKNELSLKETLIHNLKSDYELKLKDLNEKSHNLFDSLKTQEALTKQLEIQLENQIKIVKQKDNEINTLKLNGDSDQKINDLNKSLSQQAVIIKQQEVELNNAQENINTLKSKLNEMEATHTKYESLLAEIKQKDNKIAEFQEKNHSLATSLENLENTNKSLNDSIAKLKEESSELDKKLNEANEKLKEQQINNSKSQDDLQSKKDEEIQTLLTKCKSLEDQLHDVNKKLNDQEFSSSNSQEFLKHQTEQNLKKDEEIKNLLAKCKSLEDHLNESTNTVKSSNEKLELLMAKFNETTSKYAESEVKTSEAIAQKEEFIQQREQEIKFLKGQLEQYTVNISNQEQDKKNLEEKLAESLRELNKVTESFSHQRESIEKRDLEISELKERIQKIEITNKSEDDFINKEIEQLNSQLNELKKKEAQTEQAALESQSLKDLEIKCLSEKYEQIEKERNHLNEKLKEALLDKNQAVELTAKVQELEKKLSVSANIIKGLKSTKTSESLQSTEESSRLKELMEENEDLKSKNFRLKSGLAVTEKSISQLEEVIKSRETSVFEEIKTLKETIQRLENEKKTAEETGNKMIKKISKELKKEIELRKELQKNSDLTKVNAETNGTNGVSIKNGTNGTETNGTNGNGHHETATNFDSKIIELMKENERLKQQLDEEIKSSKTTLSERAKIRDLIKKGQDALEHEKQELHERFDDKILNEYELVNGNGVNKNGVNGNGVGNHTAEKI